MKKIICLIVVLISFGTLNAQSVISENGKETVNDIPGGYRIQYLAKDKDHDYFYLVIGPVKNPISDMTLDFKVFRGYTGTELEETTVFKVERFKDGGSTIIQTAAGVLYFPSPLGVTKEGLKTPSFNLFDQLVRVQ